MKWKRKLYHSFGKFHMKNLKIEGEVGQLLYHSNGITVLSKEIAILDYMLF